MTMNRALTRSDPLTDLNCQTYVLPNISCGGKRKENERVNKQLRAEFRERRKEAIEGCSCPICFFLQ